MGRLRPVPKNVFHLSQPLAHVAFIMDGNGRWAKKHLLPRHLGHKEGCLRISEIAQSCEDLGIKAMTLYAFSTENWKRPKDEIDHLFKYLDEFFEREIDHMMRDGVKVMISGDISRLPEQSQKTIAKAINLTQNNEKFIFNICLNYGGRSEIIRASKAFAQDVLDGHKKIDDLDEKTFTSYLYTSALPEVDLLIRTSGEQRTSNFLPWQLAYSEFVFTPTYWPDFTKKNLSNASSNLNLVPAVSEASRMNNIKVNDITPDTRKTMRTRIITALILVGIVLPALILGDWYFVSLCFIVLLWAIHEFINAPAHNRYNIVVHIFIYLITLGIVFWIFVKSNVNSVGWAIGDWKFENGLNHIEVSTISIAVTTCVLFMISLTNKNFTINDVTYLFTMIIFIGLSSQALLFLRYFPGFAFENNPLLNYPAPTWWSTSFLIIYVLLGTFLADIGAYFTGVIFGHNKMNPRISPKKTWEGFGGGVALSIIASLAFAFIVDACGYPLLPFMTLREWYWVVGISIVMPFLSTLGDFIFSAIKRNFNIKDYGTIFPGMGGVLDRIDSLLVTSLVVAIIITFINNGWSLLA